jgi:uncharacterized protein
MLQRVLLDTGPLVAIASPRDEHHERCLDQLRVIQPPLLTCWPVLTETAWLLRSQPTAFERILATLDKGLLALLALDASDAAAIAQLLGRYRKLGAQLADVCLLHLADRERIDAVFTLDKRDFSVYRTVTRRQLRIVPE